MAIKLEGGGENALMASLIEALNFADATGAYLKVLMKTDLLHLAMHLI